MRKFKLLLTAVLFALSLQLVGAQEIAATVDPGITPDSAFLYRLELIGEHAQIAFTTNPETKAQLASDFVAERHAEADVVFEQGAYETAAVALKEAQYDLETAATATEQIPKTEENLDTIHELQSEALHYEDYAEELSAEISTLVVAGAIDEATVTLLDVEDLEASSVELQDSARTSEVAIINTISEEQGISAIEAELIVEERAEEAGLSTLQEAEITDEFTELQQEIEKVEQQYLDAKAAGETIPNEVALVAAIEEAKTQLEVSESDLEAGLIGGAFGHLTACEHLLDNVDHLLDFAEGIEEVEVIPIGRYGVELEQYEQERLEDARNWDEDWERIRDEIAEKYPDRAGDLEKIHEQAEKVTALAESLADTYTPAYDALIAEGKTSDEATAKLQARFADEYRKAYGEEYVPPFFELTQKFEGGNKISETFSGSAPVVEGQAYTDPATGYTYTFTSGGYIYTTPSGQTYTQEYPEGFVPSPSFTTGSEKHVYTTDTPEGEVTYTYAATGYTVTGADGKTESFAYTGDHYNFHGGGELNVEGFGYEFKRGEDTTTYTYNPEFRNYVSETGDVFAPPEGAAAHSESNFEEGQYIFSHDEEQWTFDPTANTWTAPSGETHSVSDSLSGHEDSGSFTTDTGVTWTYDSSTGTWTGGGSGSGTGGEGGTAGTDGSSGSWTYDSSTGAWTSSTGETHTGSYTGDSGAYAGGTGTYGGGGTAGTYTGGDTSGGTYAGGGGDTGAHDTGGGSYDSGGGGGGGGTGGYTH